MVARWRIREDIEKANDKILSWAWQNDVPWYGHPPEGWIKPVGPNFSDKGEVPLLEPGEIEVFDMIVKEEDETLCPATEQDFSVNMQMSEDDVVIKRKNGILCPADAQCEAANVQLFESVFKREVCVCSAEEGDCPGGTPNWRFTISCIGIFWRVPLRSRLRKGTLTMKRIGGFRCQSPILEYLEANFLPWREITVLRLISKSMMRRWWGNDRMAYYDWGVAMSNKVGNELTAMREELVQHEAKEQRERREKRERREEEEEEARDGRLVEAKAYYISNKGTEGVNFKTVARKFRVYQKDLKEAYWEWVDELYESSEDDFFV